MNNISLGSRKKCFVRNGAGCGLVFKAREVVHIRIFAVYRNTENEIRDQPVGIKLFFRDPLISLGPLSKSVLYLTLNRG